MKYNLQVTRNVLLLLICMIFFILFFGITLKIIITGSTKDVDISVGKNNSYYYAELFDPIYYSYGYKYYSTFKQPTMKKYNACSLYDIDLYPDDFLSELSMSNIMHEIYFRNPTNKNAKALVVQQYKTAFAYIQNNEDFLKSILDSGEEINFIMQNDKIFNMQELRNYLKLNIDNGYAMIAKIKEREDKYLKTNYYKYDINDIPSIQLSDSDIIDTTDIISSNDALTMFKIYVSASKDDVSAQDKLNEYTEDNLFLTQIPLKCFGSYVPVYGVDDDIYAHMFYANIHGVTGIVYDYKHRGSWYMPFAGCNCPFIEEDRINWYLVKNIYEELRDINELENDIYINKFLLSPTYINLNLLSQHFEGEIKNAIVNDNTTTLHNKMWLLMNKINTKYYLYSNAYDDINMKESQRYFQGSSNNICEEYQNYVIVESMFHLNFMRWSPAVFILDDNLDFVSYNKTEPNIVIEDENDFLYRILHS